MTLKEAADYHRFQVLSELADAFTDTPEGRFFHFGPFKRFLPWPQKKQ